MNPTHSCRRPPRLSHLGLLGLAALLLIPLGLTPVATAAQEAPVTAPTWGLLWTSEGQRTLTKAIEDEVAELLGETTVVRHLDDESSATVQTWVAVGSGAMERAVGMAKAAEGDRRVLWVEPSGLLWQTEAAAAGADSDLWIQGPEVFPEDLLAYRRLTGEDKVTALIPEHLLDVEPTLASRLRAQGTALGMEVRVVTVADEEVATLDGPRRVVDRLPPDTAGVYLAPTLSGAAAAWALALHGPGEAQRRLPALSGRGPQDVGSGLLAGPRRDRRQPIARTVALALREALANPATTNSEDHRWTVPAPRGDASQPPATELRIREDTATTLSLALSWELRLESEMIEGTPAAANISLARALREGVDANLGLAVRRLRLAADGQELERALARRRPQLGVSLTGSWIDEDTAANSFGNQPERRLLATGEASWVLFSEELAAGVDVERRLQLARELEVEQARLDLALEAGSAYLEMLRAEALQRVEGRNLEVTVGQLDAAHWRRGAGAASPADVARLEARAAQERQRLADAYGRRAAAALSLNEILRRPLDRALEPAPDEIAAPQDFLKRLPVTEVARDPRRFAAVTERLARRGRQSSPGVAAADELLAAAQRQRRAAERAFYLPRVDLAGSWTVDVEEGGAGLEAPRLDLGDLGGLGSGDTNPFPEPTDERWQLSLTASLPLLTGGQRDAEQVRAELAVEAAVARRQEVAQRAELRVRTALAQLETAVAASHQARRAVAAAERAFKVVRDGYREGAEDLTTLLDAQSDARVAELRATDSVYVVHQRWLEVERAAGGFAALDADAAAFETRLFAPLETP